MSNSADSEASFNHAVHWRFHVLIGSQSLGGIVRVSLELVDETGAVLSSMKVPAAELHEILSPHLTPHVDFKLDGTLSAEVELIAAPAKSPRHIDLLKLVSHALEPAMLEDEPDLSGQLRKLKQKLSDALNLVDRTLADLNSQES